MNARATLGSARRAAALHARRSGWLQIAPTAAADVSVKPAPYLGIYERVLAPLRFRKCALLELGVWGGDSLLMWRNGLPRRPGYAWSTARTARGSSPREV